MRWGVAVGAAVSLGAAALIGTQWAGQPATEREAPDVVDAAGVAFTGAFGAGMLAGVLSGQPGLDPVGEESVERTEELPADGSNPAGQRTIRTRVSVTGSGSRVTRVTEIDTHEVRGSSRMNTRARMVVSLDYCPDPEGHVVADIDYQASGDNAAAGPAETGGYSVNVSAKGRATGTVDDQAVLTRIDQALSVEHSTRGGNGSGRREDVRGAYELTLSSGGVRQAPRVEVRSSDHVRATAASVALLQTALGPAIDSVFEEAQAKWRGGACLELRLRGAQAGGKANTTRQTERRQFEVVVLHKTGQAELPLPLEATLDGRESLEPRRVDKAPGRFDYVAGADPKDYGNVALKSVSRRGIASERVTFSNDQRWAGSFSARTRGAMQSVAEGRVTWQARPDAPDTFVPSGRVRVQGTRRDCTVSGEGEITAADGELQLRRDPDGKPVEYRGGGVKVMPLTFTCPKASGTRSAPVAWFSTTGSFRPVPADGTLEGSTTHGEVQWSWRFTP